MVGLDVTPRTCMSRTSEARFPVDNRSLLMSSSHIDTPISVSWASVSCCAVMSIALPRLAPCYSRGAFSLLLLRCITVYFAQPNTGQAVSRRFGYAVGRDAELGVKLLVVRRRAEMLQADAAARVADELPPAQGDPGLHADPRPDVRWQHLVAIGSVLLLEP